jgi:hypothetical protein
LAYAPRFFPYFRLTVVKYYRCFVFNFVGSTFFFFSNMLDIIIGLDRITIFNDQAKLINKISLLKLCSFAFLFSFIVHFPTYFFFYVRSDVEFEQEAILNLNQFTYCGQTSFLNSSIGSILTIVIVLIRDIAALIIEIVFGCICVHYYRKKLQNSNLRLLNLHIRQGKKNQLKKRNENGRRLMLMIISMSLTSIISHFIVIVAYAFSIVPVLRKNIIYFYSICFSGLSINLKHSSNYFLFYIFNRNFKNMLYK